jgi:glycosyltransferase involved in cell wall biosynthesis
MRIAVMSNLYPPSVQGGAEISTQLLAQGLKQLGHDVLVVTTATPTTPGPTHDVQSLVLSPRRPYVPGPGAAVPRAQKVAWHLLELVQSGLTSTAGNEISTFAPELVLTQNLTGFGARTLPQTLAALPRRPLVIHTLRDYELLCVKQTTEHGAGNESGCRMSLPCTLRRLSSRRFISRHVDGVVGISDYVLREHRRWGYFRDIPGSVIYNAFASRNLDTAQRDVARPHVAYLGGLRQEKGVFDLLRAYQLAFPDPHSAPTLTLAGNGSEKAQLAIRSMSGDWPVQLVGFRSPEDVLATANVLVVPSRWKEPFGRVVLDGASAGVRVLVARSGGLPEAIGLACGQTEQYGRYRTFEPGDIAGLARLIQQTYDPHCELAPVQVVRTGADVADDYIQFAESLGG